MFVKVEIVLDDREEDPDRTRLMRLSIARKLREYDPELGRKSWLLRREDVLRRLRITELNMQYDMEQYCKEM